MNCKDIALCLCAADAPSGMEGSAAEAAAKLLSPYGTTTTDPLGSVVCRLFPGEEGKNHYLLAAHLDEIGLIVTGVTPEGFLQVAAVGGVDRRMLHAAEVLVHGNGELPGVICSTPPHLQGDGERKNPKLDDVLVDIGLGGEAAKKAVKPGDRITFRGAGRELAGGLISAKALDNRAGCAVLVRVAELLHGKNLSCGVTLVLTVQEETGGAGAKTAGWPIQPTHAIAVDVTFGNTPDAEKHKTYALGGGPTIMSAPILSRRMTQRLEEVAAAKNIPFQREVCGRETGTDADGLAVTGAGVQTAVVSVPQRYMHTPVEVADPHDMEYAAALLAEYLLEEGAK